MKKWILVVASVVLVGCTNIAQTDFDSSIWEIADAKTIDLNGDGKNDNVYLLKTIQPVIGCEPDVEYCDIWEEHGVRLLVKANNKVALDYGENIEGLNYYTDRKGLFVEDITGDNRAEIMFFDNYNGASDYESCGQLFINEGESFSKVSTPKLCDSFNSSIKIDKFIGGLSGMQIAKAIPTNGVVGGNKIEQPFDIILYTWNGEYFSEYERYRSSRSYEGAGYVIDGERYLIDKKQWINDEVEQL